MKNSKHIFLSALILILLENALSFRSPDPGGRFKKVFENISALKYPAKFTIPDDNRFPNVISSEVIGGRPLSESLPFAQNTKPRKLVPRKWIGNDEDPTEYWFHNQIHTFGNTNVFGGKFKLRLKKILNDYIKILSHYIVSFKQDFMLLLLRLPHG